MRDAVDFLTRAHEGGVGEPQHFAGESRIRAQDFLDSIQRDVVLSGQAEKPDSDGAKWRQILQGPGLGCRHTGRHAGGTIGWREAGLYAPHGATQARKDDIVWSMKIFISAL